MGCDIHLVLEKHDENLSEWVGIHDYKLPPSEAVQERPVGWMSFKVDRRDYNFFAHLAGVRAHNDGEYPLPKGIPSDASSLTLYRFGQWENDAHSASWMSLKEFAYIYAREVKQNVQHIVTERLEDKDYQETLQLYEEVAGTYIDNFDELDKYRIVFWFDN